MNFVKRLLGNAIQQLIEHLMQTCALSVYRQRINKGKHHHHCYLSAVEDLGMGDILHNKIQNDGEWLHIAYLQVTSMISCHRDRVERNLDGMGTLILVCKLVRSLGRSPTQKCCTR